MRSAFGMPFTQTGLAFGAKNGLQIVPQSTGTISPPLTKSAEKRKEAESGRSPSDFSQSNKSGFFG